MAMLYFRPWTRCLRVLEQPEASPSNATAVQLGEQMTESPKQSLRVWLYVQCINNRFGMLDYAREAEPDAIFPG